VHAANFAPDRCRDRALKSAARVPAADYSAETLNMTVSKTPYLLWSTNDRQIEGLGNGTVLGSVVDCAG
jgi:hypothetical protein